MPNTGPDRNATTFSLYISAAGLNPQDVVSKVLGEDPIGSEDDYSLTSVPGLSTQQICEKHRTEAVDGGELYTELFLVADDENIDSRGLLLVNLKPYHGYPDAVRLEPEMAGMTIASLSISNTTWFELRESDEEKTPLVPGSYFTLYNLMGKDAGDKFELAVRTLNDGVHDIVPEGDEGNIDYDVPGPPYGVARQYHRGAQPDKQSIEEIAQEHAARAEREDMDPQHFAVADDEFDKAGPLFVQVEPLDSFRCRNPSAGEILGWLYIHFMTWDEAKAFADAQERA